MDESQRGPCHPKFQHMSAKENSMTDDTFLQDCGIQLDPRWLAETMVLAPEIQPEVKNYVNSLFRIADLLDRRQQ